MVSFPPVKQPIYTGPIQLDHSTPHGFAFNCRASCTSSHLSVTWRRRQSWLKQYGPFPKRVVAMWKVGEFATMAAPSCTRIQSESCNLANTTVCQYLGWDLELTSSTLDANGGLIYKIQNQPKLLALIMSKIFWVLNCLIANCSDREKFIDS